MGQLSPLLPNFNFRQIELLEKALQANIALAELNGLVVSIPNFEVLLQPLTIREAVASSEIENIHTTTMELLQAELFPTDNLPLAQKETLRYKNALLAGLEVVREKGVLTTQDIVNIQGILEPAKPGIRTVPGTAIGNRYGEIIYMPPQEEEEILELMANWEKYCNDFSLTFDALIKIVMLHYQFEAIHPFYDGNGRTGRILMVLQMVLEKRLRYPVLFLSGYILENKKQYYQCLQAVTEKGEWNEWVMFLLEGIEKQARETSSKIMQMNDLHMKFRDEFKTKLPKIYFAELGEYFFSKAFYTQSDLSKIMNLERKTAAKYLNLLLKSGLILDKKVGRDRLYFIPGLLKILD